MFVSWTTWHARSASLARRLGLEPLFLPRSIQRVPVPLRYLAAWAWMTYHLCRSRPKILAVMAPPPLAAWCAAIYGRIARVPVLFDLHSGTFNNPKWRWSTRYVLAAAKRGVVLVTNQTHFEICRTRGLAVEQVHDLVIDVPETTLARTETPQDYVLVIASHAEDEPIEAMLDAAAQLPELEFIVTGSARPEGKQKAAAIPNVRLSGYVDAATYDDLVTSAGLVVCLTTRPDTMQCGGYEALAFGKPLVTSDTAVLEEFFGSAACFAGPQPDQLAAAVTRAMASRDKLSSAMRSLRDERVAADRDAISRIRHRLAEAR